VSAIVVRGPEGSEPLRLSPETKPDVDPMLVISEMQNIAEAVRDIQRIVRIVRFRVNHLEYRATWTKYPENAERARKRADAYRVWLFHLELMHHED
jgi:hypothetical protein